MTLNLSDEVAHIAFSSPHAAVREAIEASLGDLRQALGEKGVSLGEAHVGADPGTAREQLPGEAAQRGRGSNRGAGTGIEPVIPEIAPRATVSRGLVDLFA